MELIPTTCFTIQQLVDAYNQTRIDYPVPMPMTARRLQEYVDMYDVDLDASVVAMEDDEMLGLCMLGIREGRGWITRLGVLPNTRRGGSGEAMMEYCIDQAARQGMSIVQLEVIEGNAPAHRLFRKLGFVETQKLLILRRPPGTPPANHRPPEATTEWLSSDDVIARAAHRPWQVAWTNQVESLINAGGVEGLAAAEQESQRRGWVSFKQTALQLKKVIVGPDEGYEIAPAYTLLAHLHERFPALDTIVENIPARSPYLDSFYAHGYVNSFTRIEMVLSL